MSPVITVPKKILKVEGLVKHFPVTRGILFKRQVGTVKAVDGVTFEIGEGETLGLVGESGSGKSTVARSLLRLYEPTAGSVFFEDQDVLKASRKEMAAVRREMQIVFQDPFSSLNPRMTVRTIVSEPLQIHGIFDEMGGIRYINELLERVGLSPEHAGRYPHEFSGGQRQRIGLARALALRPKLIICDEPVSALDVSVQAQIINLLEDLQNEFGLTYLFVAHDLSVVRHISDRVVVMYLGKVMEVADRLPLYETPMHPYTQALLSAVPIPDPQVERARERIILRGDVPSPLNPPTGCVFHPRCFLAERLGAEGAEETVVVGKLAPRPVPRVCVDVVPEPEEHAPGHRVACHFAQVRKVL
ncbi:MAG TPA: oligopeptide/dipeptide ABC transporter ATP-binding protein [Actinomycetota bacterium]|nr:oligopeptide/dipeptide ABC transporter ATP-binding protein [Actinomycetota bacterium]